MNATEPKRILSEDGESYTDVKKTADGSLSITVCNFYIHGDQDGGPYEFTLKGDGLKALRRILGTYNIEPTPGIIQSSEFIIKSDEIQKSLSISDTKVKGLKGIDLQVFKVGENETSLTSSLLGGFEGLETECHSNIEAGADMDILIALIDDILGN